MGQRILIASHNYKEIDEYLNGNGIRSFLLVCGGSLQYLKINDYFEKLEQRIKVKAIKFSDFQPNPLYESVVKGVDLFRKCGCDSIVAVGGGSAMDVAKCIKLYSNVKSDGIEGDFLHKQIIANDVKLLAIPTTAGTGSEATRYAVIYYNGEKESVTHDSIIPDTVLMDRDVLKTLPIYQKKVTMLDALCHSIESFWSVNSTEESKNYSRRAIKMILSNMEGYLKNSENANGMMLKAAHIAGKAINITQTTAGHAMCYKLTSLYGIAHGHAAALCVKELWSWMIKHTEKCTDSRGEKYLIGTLNEIADAMDCKNAENASKQFADILTDLNLFVPRTKDEDYELLKTSVNLVRLKNHPIELNRDTIEGLYRRMLKS